MTQPSEVYRLVYKLLPCIHQSKIEVTTTCGSCFTHLLKLHGPALLSVHASKWLRSPCCLHYVMTAWVLAYIAKLVLVFHCNLTHCVCPDRFEWAALAPLTFSPSVGHLPAGAVKDIVVTYLSDKPLQLKAAMAALKAAQLKMPPGAAASDWDNRVAAGSPGGTAAPEPKLELASAKEAPPVSLPLKVRQDQ